MDVVTLALAKKGAKQYTDTAIAGLGKGVIYKGAVNYYNDLPNNVTEGDAYTVRYKGTSGTIAFNAEFVRVSTEWVQLGPESVSDELGDITTLTTTAKTSAVAAINEINGQIGDIGAILDDINGEVI